MNRILLDFLTFSIEYLHEYKKFRLAILLITPFIAAGLILLLLRPNAFRTLNCTVSKISS